MSRQIQIRRGTTAEHAAFTGAEGEVTMDTDAKTLRVHDGETAGGFPLLRTDEMPDIDFNALAEKAETFPDADYVVKSNRTATSWYRKYKSGWVEQGGITQLHPTIGQANTVALSVPMSNNEYFAMATNNTLATTNPRGAIALNKTPTTVDIGVLGSSGFAANCTVTWEVKGRAAT